jgi:hypothetical protein
MSAQTRLAGLALVAYAALVSVPTSVAAGRGCVAPRLVGVSLASARDAVSGSGCVVRIEQLPGHGRYAMPAQPEARQIVGEQSPSPGTHAGEVTVWLKPLCDQPELPAPAITGPQSTSGTAELVVGLYLAGGPQRRRPTCATATPSAGVLTITTAQGMAVTQRAVHAGRVAIFPLPPGGYVVSGVLSSATASPAGTLTRSFTIAPSKTTRLNLVRYEP